MPFISLEFALFFVVFFPIYQGFYKSPKLQNYLLLIASYLWLIKLNPLFLATVVAITLLVYFFSKLIDKSYGEGGKLFFFAFALILIIVNLGFFKYYDDFRLLMPENVQGKLADLVMPLGLSYYSFQSIAYLHSLAKEKLSPLKLSSLALHLAFFPTITAGPIWRADDFKTINGIERGAVDYLEPYGEREIIKPALAISLILLATFKTWVLSEFLHNNIVQPVFDNPQGYDLFNLIVGYCAYTAEIFFNFSGYADLAIGLGMLLGFKIPANFKMPLLAFNLRDFWNRWHITLSTFIRDYIYIPLGGSRRGFLITQLNVMVAMVISGIWHGYGMNYLLWGFIHGLGLVLLNIFDKIYKKPLPKFFAIIFTLIFIVLTFVIFKAKDLNDVKLLFEALLNNQSGLFSLNWLYLLTFIALLISLIIYQKIVFIFDKFVEFLENINPIFWILPIFLILFIIVLLAPSGIPNFIYANF